MTTTTDRYELWNLTPFEQWLKDEEVHIITDQLIRDVYSVETKPWERTGCSAAILDLTQEPTEGALINTQGTTRYIYDIPPGGKFNAERHMYEEIFFVLKGRGATTVWVDDDGPRHTFEWKEGSVFSIPLNAWHEIYNGQGDATARLYAASSAPTAFNLYASPEFVFDCPVTFPDRFNPTDEQYFSGKSTKLADRFMQTNFIADVNAVSLDRWRARGPGANMMILMAGGHFICHVSEFPAGTYKKAHTQPMVGRGRAGGLGLPTSTAYLFLNGEGYDLQWDFGVTPGEGVPFERLNYGAGTLMTPGSNYHQHFNLGKEPSRYVVFRYGNPRYTGAGSKRQSDTGGLNIEWKDEDPAVLKMFNEELAKRGQEPFVPTESEAKD